MSLPNDGHHVLDKHGAPLADRFRARIEKQRRSWMRREGARRFSVVADEEKETLEAETVKGHAV